MTSYLLSATPAIGIPVGLKPIQIDLELHISDMQVIVQTVHNLHLQRIDLGDRNAPHLRIVLILEEEIIGVLGSHHNCADEQPSCFDGYLCTQ